jgi:hypothetical protein
MIEKHFFIPIIYDRNFASFSKIFAIHRDFELRFAENMAAVYGR